MQFDEKKELVEKLVELTVRDIVSESDTLTKVGYKFASRMKQKIRQEQVDLRLKHFAPEQIKALLNFYDTAMGKSILENQSKIDHEIASNVSIISHEVHHQVVEDIQSEILQKNAERSSQSDT
ncbi:MAG: hypothetical protein COA96_11945 [SAR86 cluster bacterium]|uniref:DUF2059 domain-containing protein n=1 Tax=SAR86 cluster bacterium TaxID=2030880 RepID=A0A2A5AVT7_9GAMM|nr:MAG: hypothetical protein COA96_11945 [SAR86 cluster bacterium]